MSFNRKNVDRKRKANTSDGLRYVEPYKRDKLPKNINYTEQRDLS